MNKKAVLLVNLGTPDSPLPKDVFRYLNEFLTDERVIDLPWLKRQLLVRGVIVPFRYKTSAKAYQAIWSKEGSPLMVYGNQLKEALQNSLGSDYSVELAMRYQNPSIATVLKKVLSQDVKELIIVPLFPQYASATTGSVLQKVQEELRRLHVIPHVTFIDKYPVLSEMIQAFADLSKPYNPQSYDHLLFSFHGLPERHIHQADKHGKCLKEKNCCHTMNSQNQSCYSAQCHSTAYAIAKALDLKKEQFSICFQSRLGRDHWLKPYTSETIHQLAKEGKKRILVFCPAFICDCLETTYEIGVEYAHEFRKIGGEQLDLVPGLNNHPLWVKALSSLIINR